MIRPASAVTKTNKSESIVSSAFFSSMLLAWTKAQRRAGRGEPERVPHTVRTLITVQGRRPQSCLVVITLFMAVHAEAGSRVPGKTSDITKAVLVLLVSRHAGDALHEIRRQIEATVLLAESTGDSK